jgi:hypothetical protein
MHQRQFELDNIDLDVEVEGYSMPPLLGFIERERVVLLVRGLHHVAGAQALLNDWLPALQLAYRKFLDHE